MKEVITDSELLTILDLRKRGFAVVVLSPSVADPILVETAMCGAGDAVIAYFEEQVRNV